MKLIEDLLNLTEDKEAIDRYVKGYPKRKAIVEKEFEERAKLQQWTKENDDFEYTI